MEYLYAPMEGITYAAYRRIHHEMFPGISEYYTPFIAPDKEGTFKPKFLKELTEDSGNGLKLIPQLMANNADSFLITARKLKDLGFQEVNLNAGCPSGTVFAKHKGSGMLTDPDGFDVFLDTVYSGAEASGLKVSIKTRMGVHSTEEFGVLMEIYRKYPISRLIVHARDRDGMYKSEPDRFGFAAAMDGCGFPVCYNGNIFSPAERDEILKITGGKLESIMLGRGIVANPALENTLAGKGLLTAEKMRAFHDALLDAYLEEKLTPRFVLERMKHLWFYLIHMFSNCRKEEKAILKSETLADYRTAAAILFTSGKFSSDGKFSQN